MDKSGYTIKTYKESDDQRVYWKSRTPHERLAAAMGMIEAAYGLIGNEWPPMEKKLVGIRKRR